MRSCPRRVCRSGARNSSPFVVQLTAGRGQRYHLLVGFVELGQRLGTEVAADDLPLVVLLGQDRPDEPRTTAGLLGKMPTPALRARLVRMSAATIDRRLRLFRLRLRPHRLGTTKPGTLLKPQVAVRTFTPWDEQGLGFAEIDLVAHCGMSTAGHYLNTLVVTDVLSHWTECIGVWGNGHAAVFAGLEGVRRRLPSQLRGIDSDNGAEFLNAHLVRTCTGERLTFTRSRPYWKNDQGHVEQQNWSGERKHVGYDRYESEAALATLHAVYSMHRRWTNHGSRS